MGKQGLGGNDLLAEYRPLTSEREAREKREKRAGPDAWRTQCSQAHNNTTAQLPPDMAKISSTAPEGPAAAPAQATRRATRSQSAEPQQQAPDNGIASNTAAAPPAAAAQRRGRKGQAKGASKSIHGTEYVCRQTKGYEHQTHPRPTTNLPPVDENVIVDDDTTEAQLAQQLHVEPDTHRPSPRRASAGSAISGTTAKTSFSQEEIEQLDHEVIVDVLPDLASASDSLAKLLAPEGPATSPALWKEIKQTGSKHNKLYNRRLATLQLHKPSFGSQEYIQPRIVLAALLGEPVPSLHALPAAQWRPDNIIFKTNLAQMLNSVLVVCDITDWTPRATDALERLDMAFPVGIAGGEFSFAAIELWLNLAAHLAIRRLDAAIATDPNFAPHDEIGNVFYDNEGQFKHLLTLGFAKASEADFERAIQMVTDLVKVLQSTFKDKTGKNATAANGKLKAQFKWDDFRSHVLRYYEARATELDRRIAAGGGVELIVKSLAREAERRFDTRHAERMKQNLTKTGSTPRRSLGGKSVMAALKAKERQILEPPATAPTAHMIAPTTNQQEDVLARDFGDNQEPEGDAAAEQSGIPASTMSAIQGFQDAQKRNKSKGKGRLIDRQDGAVLIDPNMDVFDETQPDTRPAPPSARPNKRKLTEATESDDHVPNPTQDEGFEEDTRDHANADNLRRETSFGQAPRNRYPSVGAESAAAGPSNYPPSSAATQLSPSKRQRKNPGSAIPPRQPALDPEDPAPPPSTAYQQWKVDSRTNRTMAPKPTQQRQPWDPYEESALMELIEQHCDDGISYASLKAIDNELIPTGEARLTKRSAEDLRFKSRNMKTTMLLAGAQLPRNWDKVVLDKKAVDRLHARGIEYSSQPTRSRRTMVSGGGGGGTPAPSASALTAYATPSY
ncbi:uncharacterized protein MYCFIDRAFT_170071 [Pseudocercospora fijiensis CIRAD86]|uniref:Myb-like domain-containing protein n=1 Tax=Pseudocercospora fijiensis (strain CIRAD86) TaxID=383855 RepID=N1QBD4_PSEFD|nr:uncharacterized protein MYCFIDRAFT_170071 [Pseudocercospora fijiensis CIRAD86]EME88462.1 hypothetical protein MYCFIDRAFT_170071 [Pseudocercospora fijiensis CIRAD86]